MLDSEILPTYLKNTYQHDLKTKQFSFVKGSRYGWTQKICDDAFKRDMLKKCDYKYGNRKRFFHKIFSAVKNAVKITGKIVQWPFIRGDLAKCKHGADIYYKAVASYGHVFYDKNTPEWCEKECAKKAGDPSL